MIVSKTAFSQGEIGLPLRGRTNTLPYQEGASELTNVTVNPQGSVMKRQGSVVLKELTQGQASSYFRMIAYDFNQEERYVFILFSRAMLVVGFDSSQLSQMLPTPWEESDIPNIEWTTYGNLTYLVDGKHKPYLVTREHKNLFDITPVVFDIPPTTEAVLHKTVLTEPVGVPIVGAVFSLDLYPAGAKESNAGLYQRIIAVKGSTFRGKIFSAGANGIEVIVTVAGEVHKDDEVDIIGGVSAFLKPKGVLSVGQLITLDSVTSLTNTALVSRLDPTLGKYVSIAGGLIEINPFKSTDTQVTGIVIRPPNNSNTTAIFTYLDEAFFVGNYPRTVTHYGGRLLFGGTETEKSRLWQSEEFDFLSFFTGVKDTDAIDMYLTGVKSASIQWMAEMPSGLIAGCTSSEVRVSGNEQTVSTVEIKQQTATTIGSSRQQPLLTKEGLLFMARDHRKIWQYQFNFQINAYVAVDITLVNPEITRSGIKDMNYSSSPWSSLYCLLNNGTLAVVTFGQGRDPTYAWSRYTTHGNIIAMCLLSGEPVDTLVMVVERYGKRWIETITPDLFPTKESVYTDFTFISTSREMIIDKVAPRTAIVEVPAMTPEMQDDNHLFGCKWQGEWLRDRHYLTTNGYGVDIDMLDDATINNIYVQVQMGLLYPTTIGLLPLAHDFGTGDLTYIDSDVREMRLLVWDSTRTATVNGQDIIDRHSSDITSESPPLHTGILFLVEGTETEYGTELTVEDWSVYPFNLSGVWLEVQ